MASADENQADENQAFVATSDPVQTLPVGVAVGRPFFSTEAASHGGDRRDCATASFADHACRFRPRACVSACHERCASTPSAAPRSHGARERKQWRRRSKPCNHGHLDGRHQTVVATAATTDITTAAATTPVTATAATPTAPTASRKRGAGHDHALTLHAPEPPIRGRTPLQATWLTQHAAPCQRQRA